LISVSVMPGCWARAGVNAVSESRASRATRLDRITANPPPALAGLLLLALR
jgi:hypothetical protein